MLSKRFGLSTFHERPWGIQVIMSWNSFCAKIAYNFTGNFWTRIELSRLPLWADDCSSSLSCSSGMVLKSRYLYRVFVSPDSCSSSKTRGGILLLSFSAVHIAVDRLASLTLFYFVGTYVRWSDNVSCWSLWDVASTTWWVRIMHCRSSQYQERKAS